MKTDAERFINAFYQRIVFIAGGVLLKNSINKNSLLVPVFFVGVLLLDRLPGCCQNVCVQRSINRQTDLQAGVITESPVQY